MLYATTRSNSHVETTYRAIHLERCSDGGLFVPFRLPQIEIEQIKQMRHGSFTENMASVLNLFFSKNLAAWDLEFAIGRNPVRFTVIPHRITIMEAWHCGENRYEHIVNSISRLLCGENQVNMPTNWVQIAVRIATLFASYCQMLAANQVDLHIPLDISVISGDFAFPMAAWYARKMGLPIGNIVCGCNANGAVWDFVHRGTMTTNVTAVSTNTPLADVAIPENLERLVAATLGKEGVRYYLDKCRTGQLITLSEENAEKLRSGMFVSVISNSRVETMIHSVYRTGGYILNPYAAVAYGSLLDYRAKTGESRQALLVCQRSPVCDCDLVAKSMNISVDDVLRKVSIGE